MIAYPDTSFLCALYRRQDNSDRALAYRATMKEPLHVTRLLLWEFRQSVRFQSFRYSKNRDHGHPLHEAEKMIQDLTDDMATGLVVLADCDIISILSGGERISQKRTFTGGHRGFDILHIATAIEVNAKEFLSFDANQVQLAKAEGLEIPGLLS